MQANNQFESANLDIISFNLNLFPDKNVERDKWQSNLNLIGRFLEHNFRTGEVPKEIVHFDFDQIRNHNRSLNGFQRRNKREILIASAAVIILTEVVLPYVVVIFSNLISNSIIIGTIKYQYLHPQIPTKNFVGFYRYFSEFNWKRCFQFLIFLE